MSSPAAACVDLSAGHGVRLDEAIALVLAAEYTRIRPRLLRAAYALLGTHAEAQDAVADAWLRLTAADQRERAADIEAWAVVAASRRVLDVLRSARIQREAHVGPWLPEPLIGRLPGLAGSPGARRPVLGADRVARFLIRTAATISAGQRLVPVAVNGAPGLVIVEANGRASLVASLTVAGGRILRVDLVVAPGKLACARSPRPAPPPRPGKPARAPSPAPQ